MSRSIYTLVENLYNHADIFPLKRKEESGIANCHTYEEVELIYVYISFLK
jgi:hypothetical protein